MTLPTDDVIQFLEGRFVLCHRNIEADKHVGLSHGYKPTQSAVGTTNGAGPRNVQFLVLAHDETVLHAVPGFWHPEDLIKELTLGLEVARLYGTERISGGKKEAMFRMLHQSFLRRHGPEMAARSEWQGFDRWHEEQRKEAEPRDTFALTLGGDQRLKSVPRVIHDRMAARPFMKLRDFDLERFVDYGRPFYDNNHAEKGKLFARAARVNRKREAEQQKAREKRVRAQCRASRR